ncbi:MAG TPA: TonB-dependent receptor [candidate division Zixibacteria bacterium]|nr:TonB-dependent receptor [candidate division Zixibacteria bacterium]
MSKQAVLLSCLLLVLFTGVATFGQVSTAQMNGTVTDASGAVVPNATITVKDPATGFTRSTHSSTTGAWVIPNLPPSSYDLKVEGKGFATVAQSKITLLVGQTATLNFTLKPGAANEVVNVTNEAPLIETSTSQIMGEVSPTEVSNLPLVDRNFAGLMTLVPGVRQAEAFDPTKTHSGNVSIDGSDGRSVDYNVDGGDNKDNVIGGLVQNFTMEGIQEFNVITNRYTAEAGRTAGAVVNVVTKSGTNSLHGSAFGQFQTSSLFATDYFSKQNCEAEGISDVSKCKPKYHRQHMGGSFGGPIIKDKFFFFMAMENKREPATVHLSPTAANEFQAFNDGTTGYPGAPYADIVGGLSNTYIDWEGTGKLDFKINDKQNLSMRYGREKWTQDNDQLGGSPVFADGSQGNTDVNQFHDLSIAHNIVISPTKTNTLTLHFQDFVNAIGAAPTRTFQYPVSDGTSATNPNIIFKSGEQVGLNQNVPQETLIRKYQFRDDFSWVKGDHSLKFGANWIYLAKLGGYFYSSYGYGVRFWDDPTTITSNPALYPEGFATPGAVAEITYSAGSASTSQPTSNSIGLYIQDDYKVSRKLTLNLGIRWDANPGFLQSQLRSTQTTSNRVIWDLEQTAAAVGNSSDPAVQASMAAINPIIADHSLLTKGTADWKEFQPRLGFAWDVNGNGKNVIRGGYGIARDQIFQNLTLWSIQQSQQSIYQVVLDQTSSVAPGTAGCTGPLCTWRFGVDGLPAAPGNITDLAYGAVGRITNPHITDPWAQQMSIGWATQISTDYSFSVDYTHVLGTHGERVLNANPTIPFGDGSRVMDAAFQAANICAPVVGGTECAAGTTDSRFAHIYEYSTNNRSLYDGVNFQLKKRMTKNFQFQASYVLSWSRSWGGFPVNAYLGSGQAVAPQNQFNPNEWARTNNDERNRVVLSGVFNLPWGFNLSPLFQAASARPYSFAANTDIDGDGRHVLDRVCVGSTVADPILPLPGATCTQLKPNTLDGKPFVQMDLRAGKTFKIGERLKTQLTAEFFNLFNRANFCNGYYETTPGKPANYCGGPVVPVLGQTGYSASPAPSFRSQFGVRFDF